ncbi:MAG: OadG family protein [Oscillospiraceae bacterium]|nr:OadG family protein [Oscillospiraceae bacterium]
MNDLVNLSLGDGAGIAVLGYLVVFLGIVMLMLVVMLMSRIMIVSKAKAAKTAPVKAVDIPADAIPLTGPQAAITAPGTAGELKLYDTEPRDAAMIMAILADSLGKPLNELRFLSIREIKEEY